MYCDVEAQVDNSNKHNNIMNFMFAEASIA